MDMICNTEWSEAQARRVATLMVNPRTNGGLAVQELLKAPVSDEQVVDLLTGLVRVSASPMVLLEEGERALSISADPYSPDGRGFLHFSARGFAAAEVRPRLAEFMQRFPAREWVAIGTRPGLWRLICQPLGFTLVEQLKDAFLAMKGGN